MRPNSLDFMGTNLPRTQYESLPGQKQLFPECEGDLTTDTSNEMTLRHELFETGKDLPGAEETDQSILWDVA